MILLPFVTQSLIFPSAFFLIAFPALKSMPWAISIWQSYIMLFIIANSSNNQSSSQVFFTGYGFQMIRINAQFKKAQMIQIIFYQNTNISFNFINESVGSTVSIDPIAASWTDFTNPFPTTVFLNFDIFMPIKRVFGWIVTCLGTSIMLFTHTFAQAPRVANSSVFINARHPLSIPHHTPNWELA